MRTPCRRIRRSADNWKRRFLHSGYMPCRERQQFFCQGLQFTLFGINFAKKIEGLQLAFINFASQQLEGLQVGFFNHANSDEGFQWGFINYCEDDATFQLGFLNFNKNGLLPVMIFLNFGSDVFD